MNVFVEEKQLVDKVSTTRLTVHALTKTGGTLILFEADYDTYALPTQGQLDYEIREAYRQLLTRNRYVELL